MSFLDLWLAWAAWFVSALDLPDYGTDPMPPWPK